MQHICPICYFEGIVYQLNTAEIGGIEIKRGGRSACHGICSGDVHVIVAKNRIAHLVSLASPADAQRAIVVVQPIVATDILGNSVVGTRERAAKFADQIPGPFVVVRQAIPDGAVGSATVDVETTAVAFGARMVVVRSAVLDDAIATAPEPNADRAATRRTAVGAIFPSFAVFDQYPIHPAHDDAVAGVVLRLA